MVERALQAEMDTYLGYSKNSSVSNVAGNTRNGKSSKILKGEFGELPIEIPRDRHGSFEPQIISKHQTRWRGFDDKIPVLFEPRRGTWHWALTCAARRRYWESGHLLG